MSVLVFIGNDDSLQRPLSPRPLRTSIETDHNRPTHIHAHTGTGKCARLMHYATHASKNKREDWRYFSIFIVVDHTDHNSKVQENISRSVKIFKRDGSWKNVLSLVVYKYLGLRSDFPLIKCEITKHSTFSLKMCLHASQSENFFTVMFCAAPLVETRYSSEYSTALVE